MAAALALPELRQALAVLVPRALAVDLPALAGMLTLPPVLWPLVYKVKVFQATPKNTHTTLPVQLGQQVKVWRQLIKLQQLSIEPTLVKLSLSPKLTSKLKLKLRRI